MIATKTRYNVTISVREKQPVQPDSHSVHGRLKSHNSLRELLGASEFILSAIRDGCKIPFSTTPPRFWSKNNRSCLDNCDFVTEAILEFIPKMKFQKSIPKNYTILILCRYVFNLAARKKGSSLGDQSRSLQIKFQIRGS